MANMNNNMNDINTTCISDEDKYWEEFDKAMNSMRAPFEHEKHDINLIFTRKGKKYSAMLRHMVNYGNAKSGATMRQIYRYCYQYLFDKGWTQFYPPVFNAKCKYIVELGNDNKLYITNVSRRKRLPKSINERMLEEERHHKWEEGE